MTRPVQFSDEKAAAKLYRAIHVTQLTELICSIFAKTDHEATEHLNTPCNLVRTSEVSEHTCRIPDVN